MVTAIWEMKGRKHLRTIDPRSRQGREILNLYTTEEEHPPGRAKPPRCNSFIRDDVYTGNYRDR